MSIKAAGQVANYKPLAECGMDEIAARQRGIEPSGGILFARNGDGAQKTAARQQVLDLFHPDRWPRHLHMLTMPSIHWRFERKLLAVREVGWLRYPAPKRTHFTACENDRAIYFAAIAQMPGLNVEGSELKQIRHFAFAEMGAKTRYATIFLANVDDLMAQDYWDNGWDAAWLDYTGPLSIERLAIITRFYERYVREILIVTALKARWNDKTGRAIRSAGGHSEWLRANLDGEILHDLNYLDSSPMAQFAVRKRKTWRSPLV